MRLELQFGLNEPKRQMSWWGGIKNFPPLVTYKGKKWEFVIYQDDPTGAVDYICTFGEVPVWDPAFESTGYIDMASFLEDGWGKCECGAIYTSFKDLHMRYCPKYIPWR